MENYVRSVMVAGQLAVSPVTLLTNWNSGFASKPMMFFSSQNDHMPFHQIQDVDCALQAAGVTSYTITIVTDAGNCAGHSFGFFQDVHTAIDNFFDTYLRVP